MPPTISTSAAIFCPRGSLLREASASCALRATSMLLGRVVHAAGDFPVDRAGIGLLRRLLDTDVGEILGSLHLLHEGGQILVRYREPLEARLAGLLLEVADPDPLRNDDGELVEDLHRPRAGLLQGIEDLQLVLELLLVFGDGLHFADRLLELGDLGAGGADLVVHLGEAVVDGAVPEVVPDERADDEHGEQHQELLPELLLLLGPYGEEVDADHGFLTARSSGAGRDRWRPPPKGPRPSRSSDRSGGCRPRRPLRGSGSPPEPRRAAR